MIVWFFSLNAKKPNSFELSFVLMNGAGDGNRTHVVSLEG